jgi:RNA methyltransferase, TrmH family
MAPIVPQALEWLAADRSSRQPSRGAVVYTADVAITSRQNPLVARYRAAAAGDADGVILLDGAHLIADALAAGLLVRHASVTTAAREDRDIAGLLATLERRGTETVVVSASVMDAISPVRTSTGIVALAARPEHADARVFSAAQPLVVIAVDVQDPGNLGAIARVAEAGGASGLIAAGSSADPFGWKALRGAMGSSLRLPVARLPIDDAIDGARRHGCRIVAAAPRDARPMYDVDLTGPCAILIGGEGHGLPQPLLEAADERAGIPMQPPVESLNAAVAAALIVYEARRQRQALETRD